MINSLNDIAVQFAKLWGVEVADSRLNKPRYLELEAYDSEELTELLTSWADEYSRSSCNDTVEFFENKMDDLFHENTLKPSLETIIEVCKKENEKDVEVDVSSFRSRKEDRE